MQSLVGLLLKNVILLDLLGEFFLDFFQTLALFQPAREFLGVPVERPATDFGDASEQVPDLARFDVFVVELGDLFLKSAHGLKDLWIGLIRSDRGGVPGFTQRKATDDPFHAKVGVVRTYRGLLTQCRISCKERVDRVVIRAVVFVDRHVR